MAVVIGTLLLVIILIITVASCLCNNKMLQAMWLYKSLGLTSVTQTLRPSKVNY